MHEPTWTAASLADAEALIQLGYAKGQKYTNTKWLKHYVPLASPTQHAELLRQLPDMVDTQKLANDLMQLAPAPELLPAIEEVLQQCTDDSEIAWFNQTGSNGSLYALANLAAMCEHPEAGRVLAQFTMRHPSHVDGTYAILCSLSLDRSDELARNALRKLLVMPLPQDSKRLRNIFFGELVRAGDTEAIPLLSKAYELGLQPAGFTYPSLQPWTGRPESRPSIQHTGIGLLTESNSTTTIHHNYQPADLARAWQSLLTGPASDVVWSDLTSSSRGSYSKHVPVPALPMLSKQLLARWQPTANKERNPLEPILYSFGSVQPESLATNNGLRDSIRALITSPQQDLASGVFAYLDDAVAQEFATIGLEQFRASKSLTWFRALVRKKVQLREADWLAALSGDRDTKLTGLSGVPKGVTPTVRQAVEALLGDSDPSVRKNSCEALARIAGPDAVALLLPMLQDETDFVRKGVRGLLAQMREEQEQRNFWARIGDVELTTATAAAKLIKQAMPGEDQQQRLLAIRSLALLGAAETLPYLIDWTKDKDAQVQAAAKQAVADIHQKGAATTPANKK